MIDSPSLRVLGFLSWLQTPLIITCGKVFRTPSRVESLSKDTDSEDACKSLSISSIVTCFRLRLATLQLTVLLYFRLRLPGRRPLRITRDPMRVVDATTKDDHERNCRHRLSMLNSEAG